MAAEKVDLPSPPPYLSLALMINLNKSHDQLLKGVNFASGGSGIMNETNNDMSVSGLIAN